MDEHFVWMNAALRQAEKAFEADEVPVGAVVVQNNNIIGTGYNQVERLNDSTAHAEIIALTAAMNTIGSKWLPECCLYVTLEPCSMCAGAIVLARLDQLVFAANDPKSGACGSLYNIVQDPRLNHRVKMISGIMEDRSSAMLKEFFSKKRKKQE